MVFSFGRQGITLNKCTEVKLELISASLCYLPLPLQWRSVERASRSVSSSLMGSNWSWNRGTSALSNISCPHPAASMSWSKKESEPSCTDLTLMDELCWQRGKAHQRWQETCQRGMAGRCDVDPENKKVVLWAQTRGRRQTQAPAIRVCLCILRSEVVPHEYMERN